VPMPGAFLIVLAVFLAILFPALAHFGPVLVDVQPVLQLLGTALLFRRRVSFFLLLVQRVEFLLQGVVARPRWLIGLSHGSFLRSSSERASSYQIAPAAVRPAQVRSRKRR
jgi:hypothetical protein